LAIENENTEIQEALERVLKRISDEL